VRFITQPPSLAGLTHELRPLISRALGSTRVNRLELTENDWYMRTSTLAPVNTYTLPSRQ